MKYQKYDLGHKQSPGLDVPAENAAAPRIDYPSFSVSADKEMKFPEGEFMAMVCLRSKGGEWNEDEKGNKRHTFRFEVQSIEPCKCDPKEDADEPEEEDAAAAIMKGMRGARTKKIAEEKE